jgi:hypothetical protein
LKPQTTNYKLQTTNCLLTSQGDEWIHERRLRPGTMLLDLGGEIGGVPPGAEPERGAAGEAGQSSHSSHR